MTLEELKAEIQWIYLHETDVVKKYFAAIDGYVESNSIDLSGLKKYKYGLYYKVSDVKELLGVK